MRRPTPPPNVILPGPQWWPDGVLLIAAVIAGAVFVGVLLSRAS